MGSVDRDGDWVRDSLDVSGDWNLNGMPDTEVNEEGLIRLEWTMDEFKANQPSREERIGAGNEHVDVEPGPWYGSSRYYIFSFDRFNNEIDDGDNYCYQAKHNWHAHSMDDLDWANPGKNSINPN